MVFLSFTPRFHFLKMENSFFPFCEKSEAMSRVGRLITPTSVVTFIQWFPEAISTVAVTNIWLKIVNRSRELNAS